MHEESRASENDISAVMSVKMDLLFQFLCVTPSRKSDKLQVAHIGKEKRIIWLIIAHTVMYKLTLK